MEKAAIATINLFLDTAGEDADPAATMNPSNRAINAAETIVSPTGPTERPSPESAAFALASLPRLMLAGGEYDNGQPRSRDGEPDITLFRKLGEGGMGVVYLAEQAALARKVAVKLVRKEVKKPEQVAALLTEARMMGSLDHPGTVPVYAIGTDSEQRPVMLMKRIEGVEWDELIAKPDHVGWATMRTHLTKSDRESFQRSMGETPRTQSANRLLAHLDILMNVSSTIAFAHNRGILHRDIKPTNVMVGAFGEVYLFDWGVALDRDNPPKLRAWGPTGTPSFMAPELVVGDPKNMDERTDVYLLGATLHVCLTQTPRHRGKTLRDILFAAVESDPVEYDADVPKDLAELANRATSRDPDDRPASALEFRDALAEYVRHHGSRALTVRAESSLRRAQDPDLDALSLRRHLIESRFGFEQALEQWPSNESARQGRSRALEASVDLEISERAPGSARALLHEFREPRPDLEARVEDLQRSIDEDARDAVEARALARDHDPNIARMKRTIFLVALAVAATTVTFVMRGFRQNGTGYPLLRTIAMPIGVAVALSPVAFWLRGDMNKSAVNRRFLGIVYAVCGLMVIVRALAYVMHTHIVHMMVFELTVITTAAVALAITFNRAFGWVALAAVACAFLGATNQDSIEFFYVPPIIGLVALSVLLRRGPTLTRS